MLKLNEATPYNITDQDNAKKTSSRVLAVQRVMDQLERAVAEAEKQNQPEKAAAFRQRIDDLQELIDRAPVDEPEESEQQGNSEGEAKNGSDNPEESGESEDEPKTGESETNNPENQEEGPNDTENPETEEPEDQKEPEARSTKTNAQHSKEQQTDTKQNNNSSASSESTPEEDAPENSEESGKSDGTPEQPEDAPENSKETEPPESEQKENPFADMIADAAADSKNKDKEKLSVEEIIEILKKVDGEGAKGINQALTDILTKRGVSTTLTETLRPLPNKALEQLSDDEFNDIINNTLDEIDTVIALPYLNAEDKKQRNAKIQADLKNVLANRALDIEDNVNLQPERAKVAARERELKKYNNLKSITDFKINFWRAINDQVEKYEESEETFSRINKKHEDPAVFKRGERTVEKWKEEKPSIDIYFDQSGSWTDDKAAVEMGQSIVKTMDEFKQKDQIELNVYYFSNWVVNSIDDPSLGGGTGAWNDILQNIKTNKAKNVVLMTDSDMYSQAAGGPNCVVDGCVWIIWRHGSQAESIPKHLQGRLGTYQYAF